MILSTSLPRLRYFFFFSFFSFSFFSFLFFSFLFFFFFSPFFSFLSSPFLSLPFLSFPFFSFLLSSFQISFMIYSYSYSYSILIPIRIPIPLLAPKYPKKTNPNRNNSTYPQTKPLLPQALGVCRKQSLRFVSFRFATQCIDRLILSKTD